MKNTKIICKLRKYYLISHSCPHSHNEFISIPFSLSILAPLSNFQNQNTCSLLTTFIFPLPFKNQNKNKNQKKHSFTWPLCWWRWCPRNHSFKGEKLIGFLFFSPFYLSVSKITNGIGNNSSSSQTTLATKALLVLLLSSLATVTNQLSLQMAGTWNCQ